MLPQRNLAMMMDLYEMTMANGYFNRPEHEAWVSFDVFYRKNPDGGGFAIFAGLEQILEYLEQLHFTKEDVDYLRSLGLYKEGFLDWLQQYRFRGDVTALREGTVMYPNEPIMTVYAPLIDAQLVETFILTQMNHQSLVATKANRIVQAAQGRSVSDFGARRAHNVDAAVYGARAAYIGGVDSTATVLAGQQFGIPVSGTMAHSWVMYHEDEYTAFAQFAECYPDSTVLLVDPQKPWKQNVFSDCRAERLHKTMMKEGKRTLPPESLESIRGYVRKQLAEEIWPEEQRFENPHLHFVDMSPAYYEMKIRLLEQAQNGKKSSQ